MSESTSMSMTGFGIESRGNCGCKLLISREVARFRGESRWKRKIRRESAFAKAAVAQKLCKTSRRDRGTPGRFQFGIN
jgi:hypothetical protein